MFKRTVTAALVLGSIVLLTAACGSSKDNNAAAAPTTTTTFDVQGAVNAYLATTTTTEAPTTTTTEAPTTTTTRPRPVVAPKTTVDSSSSDPDVFMGFCHYTSDDGTHWSELSVQSECSNLPGFKTVWTRVPKGYNEASPEAMLKMNPADYSYGSSSSSSCYIPGTYVPGVTIGDTYVPGVYVPGVDAC